MGFPFHELSSSAILLDHPGVTKEEFAERLGQIPSYFTEYTAEDLWDIRDKRGCLDHDLPLERLAYELNLEYRREFRNPVPDKYGAPLLPISYQHIRIPNHQNPTAGNTSFEDGSEPQWPHEVSIHVANKYGPLVYCTIQSSGLVKKGDFLPGDFVQDPGFLIRELSHHDQINQERQDILHEYHAGGVLVEKVFVVEKFPTKEEAFLAWPELHPENRFDWLQQSGYFYVSHGGKAFCWINIEGKYFLDKDTFNKIPVSFRTSKKHTGSWSYGYTDLVLTAEAIKYGAWKLLSRRGIKHRDQFLKDFPGSRSRYEQAVLDAEISWNAKLRGLTYTELLRMRLVGRV